MWSVFIQHFVIIIDARVTAAKHLNENVLKIEILSYTLKKVLKSIIDMK